MKRNGRRGTTGWLMAWTLAGVLAVTGCSGSGAAVQAEPEQPVAVQVARAERGTLKAEETVYGTLGPAREALVAPKLSGTLLRLEADVNDRVEKGQLLAVIEHEQLEIQKRLNELALEQAMEQLQELLRSGAGDRQLEQAMRGVEQARLNLRLSEINLEHAFVTAPIAGRVAEVLAREGDVVSGASPLFRIVADERMTVTVHVSIRQRMLLERLDEVKVVVPDLGAERTANVTLVSGVPNGGLYAVEAELDNPGDLVPGMAAYIVLERALAEDAVIVPTAAIVEKGGTAGVFAVEDGRAREVRVDVLATQTDRTAVSGSLAEGSLIVTKGQLLLRDGTPVTIAGEGR